MTTRARVNVPCGPAREINIRRVKTTHNQDQANELLALGWVLLHAGCSHIDNYGLNAKPVFILGEP